jgi:hypothetical protein
MDSFFQLRTIPDTFLAGNTIGWIFTAWAGGAVVAIFPWALRQYMRDKDYVPMLVMLGGLLCAFCEPLIDHMVHLWYPWDLPGEFITAFGVRIPALIPPCYVVFVSATGYWAYSRMRRGITYSGVFKVWLWMCVADLLLEIPGVQMGAYKYYGLQTFFILKFPLHIAWANGVAFLLVGFLLHTLLPRTTGWERVAVSFLAPTFGFIAGWAIADWPTWLALNSDLSLLPATMASLCSLALSVLAVHAIARVVVATQHGHQIRSTPVT